MKKKMQRIGRLSKIVTIRAHHLLCIQGFQGYGYSKEFQDTLSKIVLYLKKNPNLFFKIISGPDCICQHCPYLSGSNCSIKTEADLTKKEMDILLLEKIGITTDQVKSANEIFQLTTELDRNDVKEICGDCGWQDKCRWYQTKI
jgi:hypothetical protein